MALMVLMSMLNSFFVVPSQCIEMKCKDRILIDAIFLSIILLLTLVCVHCSTHEVSTVHSVKDNLYNTRAKSLENANHQNFLEYKSFSYDSYKGDNSKLIIRNKRDITTDSNLNTTSLATTQAQPSTTTTNGSTTASNASSTSDPIQTTEIYTNKTNSSPNSLTASTSPNLTTTENPSEFTTSPGSNITNTTEVHDDRQYYTVRYVEDEAEAQKYWREMNSSVKQTHVALDGHRVALQLLLPWKFKFYGHDVDKITVAVGGFLYMSPYLHRYLTATQYVAPLMANFDATAGQGETDVFFANLHDALIIEWQNMHLNDQEDAGGFSFQAQLYKNTGQIVFAYKNVPIPVGNISDIAHSVKVGIADAFYVDIGPFRSIYDYHTIKIDFGKVKSNSAIILNHKTTCNMLEDCLSCHAANLPGFECHWCDTLGRCSDSLDRRRQEWVTNSCPVESVDREQCASAPPTSASTSETTISKIFNSSTSSITLTASKSSSLVSSSSSPSTISLTSHNSSLHGNATTPGFTTESSKTFNSTNHTSVSLSPKTHSTSMLSSSSEREQKSTTATLPTRQGVGSTTDNVTSTEVMNVSVTYTQPPCASAFNTSTSECGDQVPSKQTQNEQKDQKKSSHLVVQIITPIIFLLILSAIVFLIVYGYRNPTSVVGQFLIKYRPGQLRRMWRSRGSREDSYRLSSRLSSTSQTLTNEAYDDRL
ncbi:PLXDC2 [Bugula neritina]|uniref:PLXDC2 n=1 Tax=Bugula neritina TaxID=10212 RepID=A0A7J7JIF5_BUGNE|nr:PLXDC2 [Bugula neritina]